MSAFSGATLVRTTAGDIYGFGFNYDGNLVVPAGGYPDGDDLVHQPTLIPGGRKWRHFSVGYSQVGMGLGGSSWGVAG